jgi:hypothetical protein
VSEETKQKNIGIVLRFLADVAELKRDGLWEGFVEENRELLNRLYAHVSASFASSAEIERLRAQVAALEAQCVGMREAATDFADKVEALWHIMPGTSDGGVYGAGVTAFKALEVLRAALAPTDGSPQ